MRERIGGVKFFGVSAWVCYSLILSMSDRQLPITQNPAPYDLRHLSRVDAAHRRLSR
jgi:hypothetical protein